MHLSSLSGGPPLLTMRKPHVDILAFPKAAQRRLPTDTLKFPSLSPRQVCSKSNQQELTFAFLLILFGQASGPYASLNIPKLSTFLLLSILLEKEYFKGQKLDSGRAILPGSQ